MKLTITIDVEPDEVEKCIKGVPSYFFDGVPTKNVIHLLARALRDAYREATGRDIRSETPGGLFRRARG